MDANHVHHIHVYLSERIGPLFLLQLFAYDFTAMADQTKNGKKSNRFGQLRARYHHIGIPMKESIFVEGDTLSAAIISAADQFGVPPQQVGYSFERDHFFNEKGKQIPVETVRISAWKTDPIDTTGADESTAWLQKLTELMGIETKIHYRITGDKSAEITFDSKHGGRLVGRRGAALKSISLLNDAISQINHKGWTFQLEVLGGEKKAGGRDRGDRRGDRGDRGDRRGRVNQKAAKDLEKLASKLASKVIETGEEIAIRQNLNSFERRVVHLKIQSIDGVKTESFMDDDVKRIKILPDSE